MHSPIQLKDHKILRINFETLQLGDGPSELIFSHAISVEKRGEQDHTWLIRLDVQFKRVSDEAMVPYLGEIAVVGIFSLDDEFPENEAEAMVHLNGGAILYGMVRELLSNITSRGIHGPILLPTIDARSFLPASKEESKEE